MDYGAILRRAWDIVWNNKWLIVLGILISLGSGSNLGSSFGGNNGAQFDQGDFENGDFEGFEGFEGFDFDNVDPRAGVLAGVGTALLIPLICLGVLVGLAFWVISVISRGGLIRAVDVLDGGGTLTFGDAWRAGAAKMWRLLGISILPAIPVLILVGLALASFGPLAGISAGTGRDFGDVFTGLGIGFAVLGCLAGLAALVLGLLSDFAYRAAMLEDTAVWESYGRGWAVLSDNLGRAIVLFLIQIGIGLAVGLALLILSPILCLLCLIIIPVSIIVNGGLAAFFQTVWTLAWRQWTGRGNGMVGGEPVMAEIPPAV